MTTAEQRIPILDLTPEIDELWDELNAAVQRVLREEGYNPATLGKSAE